VEAGYVQYVVQQQRTKNNVGKIKSLAGAVFTAITKGHLLEEYRKALQQRQKATARKAASSPADLIRYRLQEAQEAYEVMQRKNTAKGATFEEHLQLVYLSQGFSQQADGQGVVWLVKEA
jgi:hypothetical protein